MFGKNYFVSPVCMPTGSLDSPSEIHASSVLVMVSLHFLCQLLLQAQVGFGVANRHETLPPGEEICPECEKTVMSFIDCSFVFEPVNRNPWLNKEPWIQFTPCIIDFQAELVP